MEGFDALHPDTSEYLRRSLTTAAGRSVIAYHYNRPVDALAAIPAGIWPPPR
ncbi:hypothetical protein [Stakelama flava]|uniref:hypothetical protein n=1 Tax=Stakelama flava TaxID=2860338 RepID=UPI003CCEC69C